MWNLVYASAQGTSHLQTGQPCQDYCAAVTTDTDQGTVLLAACADGAGSAEMAEAGARLAVDTYLATASGAIGRERLGPGAIDQQILRGWIDAARQRLLLESESRKLPLRQFACTFLAAIVWPEFAAFSQIGDGVIVVEDQGDYHHVFWPESGEYANTTRFLTDLDFGKYVHFDVLYRPIQDVAIVTDGLQMLALSKATGKVHDPFFKPMFENLRRAPNRDILRDSLSAFLNSSRVNERTDDDKTILLATRRPLTNHVPNGDTPAD